MNNDGKGILGDRRASGEEIRRAWEVASLAAMQQHRLSEEPVVTWDWEASRVEIVSAEEFLKADKSSPAEQPVLSAEQ